MNSSAFDHSSSAKPSLLFVTARFPWPLTKGDRLRAFHQIRMLSDSFEITLVSMEEPSSTIALKQLACYCRQMVWYSTSALWRVAGVTYALLAGLPVQTGYYGTTPPRRIRAYLSAAGEFNFAFFQLVRTASLLDYIARTHTARRILLDFVDALSLSAEGRRSMSRYALAGLFWRREASTLRQLESRLIEKTDVQIAISSRDREALGSRTKVLPNGVASPGLSVLSKTRENAIVFHGNLAYEPNVHAVEYLAREVFPLVRRLLPDWKLEIVGANPTPAVRRLSGPGISLHADVPSVEPYLQRACVGVYPVESGAGLQNKVLEAMANGLPVVTSEFVQRGLPELVPGHNALVANGPGPLADAIVMLATNPLLGTRLAHEAYALVEGKYSWEAHARWLGEFLREPACDPSK